MDKIINAELIGIIAIFVTMILGFLGIFIAMFQLHHQLRTEIKQDISKLEDKISKLDNDIKISNGKLSDRIDKLYEMMLELYKYFVKRDAA